MENIGKRKYLVLPAIIHVERMKKAPKLEGRKHFFSNFLETEQGVEFVFKKTHI